LCTATFILKPEIRILSVRYDPDHFNHHFLKKPFKKNNPLEKFIKSYPKGIDGDKGVFMFFTFLYVYGTVIALFFHFFHFSS